MTTPLPCMHLSPDSMTDHFEESIMIGTREMSGSAATRCRKRTIAASESSMPSSMFTSIICAPLATCWRAMSTAVAVVVRFDQLAELGGAGDVGALADVHEQAVAVEVSGSRPLNRILLARRFGLRAAWRADCGRDHADVIGRGAAAAADRGSRSRWPRILPGSPPFPAASPRTRRRRWAGRRSGYAHT